MVLQSNKGGYFKNTFFKGLPGNKLIYFKYIPLRAFWAANDIFLRQVFQGLCEPNLNF